MTSSASCALHGRRTTTAGYGTSDLALEPAGRRSGLPAGRTRQDSGCPAGQARPRPRSFPHAPTPRALDHRAESPEIRNARPSCVPVSDGRAGLMSRCDGTFTILVEEPSGSGGLWDDRDRAVGFENIGTYVPRTPASQAEFDARIVPGLRCPADANLAGRDDARAKTRTHTRVVVNRRLGPAGLRC
jgi:hypothetical protein